MKHVILSVGVESLSDDAIPPLPFAAADAARFAEVLEHRGSPESERIVLLDGQATKTAFESKLRRTLKTLTEADELFVFYAGRTFSLDGENYLTTFDTQGDEPVETSLSLDVLLATIEKSACGRVVLFLDRCESDFGDAPDDALEPFDDAAFETTTGDITKLTTFLSCRTGQTSFRGTNPPHGIWAQHLCVALAGDVTALMKNGVLTPAALQKHLDKAVPRTLVATFSGRKKQTPWRCGGDESPLVEFAGIKKEKSPAAAPDDGAVRRVVLTSVKRIDVKQLPGFNKKLHRVPDAVSRYHQSFVAGLATPEIKTDLDAVYARLKKAFGFARADLAVAESGDGTGGIVTPFFNYAITVALDPEQPAVSVWTRSIDAIKAPEKLVGDAFAAVFDGLLDTLTYEFPTPLDLETFVDDFEARPPAEYKLEYDRELTDVRVKIPDFAGAVRATTQGASITLKTSPTVRKLVMAFQRVKPLLAGSNGSNVKGLPNRKL